MYAQSANYELKLFKIAACFPEIVAKKLRLFPPKFSLNHVVHQAVLLPRSGEHVTCSPKLEAERHVVWRFLSRNVGTVTKVCSNTIEFFSLPYEGGHGGLMVSAPYSGSSGPGSRPGRGTALFSRCFPLSLFSTQVYKWVPANLLLGGNPATD